MASDREIRVHGATYQNVDQSYLEQRQLKRSAGWVLLWALGVAAVISGDFFGWQFGLAVGGFGGLLVATVVIAIMYVCMVLCIAEMSTALPHAGGFYSFTRNAFGPGLAFTNGVTDIIEYVVTPAVIVAGIAGYADVLVDLPNWVWWALFYVAFVAINAWGTQLTFRVSMGVAVASMVVLVVFYIGAIVSGAFHTDLLNNIPPVAGNSTFLPFGIGGVLKALPYAIWFYLAIEQLPLAAEESHDVVKDMPKALIWGTVTLLVLSVFTLVLNSGVAGGAAEVGASTEPLFIGFKAVFGDGATTTFLTVIALIGLIASFHAIIYAYGRILFALSRAGYIPRSLSVVSKRHTPARALVVGAVVGFGITLILDVVGGADSSVGAALLNMAVFGAVISYAIVMVSYVALKRRRTDLARPYVSPLGIPGAIVGTAIAVLSLVATFADAGYRKGVYGVAAFLFVMLAYYFLYSRHRLVAQAPEEEQALIKQAEAEIV
jgi:ethanolamine permease